jgi:hypothetical protein
VKKPALTAADVAALFEYRDGELYWKVRPATHRYQIGRRAGHINRDGYRYVFIGRRHVAVHRIVWMLHRGELPALIDHINREPLDNRVENLRACTAKENARNRSKHAGCLSKYRGVTFNRSAGKDRPWQAVITIDRKTRHLGVFSTEAAAAAAYDAAAAEAFGEFANLNFQEIAP